MKNILLVDDEESIISSVSLVLEDSGYVVSPFQNPLTALDFFHNEPQKIDLLLTDLTMPGMTGTELIEKLKSSRQDLPVIMMSGFASSEEERQKADIFLTKPISIENLLDSIQKLLS